MTENEEVVDLSDIRAVVTTYRAAVSEIARWTKTKDELGKTLKGVMANATVAVVDQVPALRLTRRCARRFDTAGFREAHPELYDFYVIEREELALNVIKSDDAPTFDFH